ncbi:hypothetical protein SAMN06295885_0358 [Rathayibacter oskolensis]|uniref:Uncharacterized protein n=1 Tax=Rathayibacter oskolensis TaxID=1891671 RepID=A0A1X7N0N6_9MICO|nr:hypothetical protein [Rathayibacter oskolensis]SMH29894.1 hypothetical protein SAMN06295885_0358 [Rathayibacter oskolensis]
MTNKPEKTERTILAGDDWSVPAENGVGRRTLVQATAWTIPVVASAVATPAFAASLSPTLEIVNGPFAVTACSAVPTVVVHATTDGSTPVASGTPITITLPAGYSWSDGTTAPKVFPTGANGDASVTGVVAGPANGTAVITATGNGTSDTTTVTTTGEKLFLKAATPTSTGVIRSTQFPAGLTITDLQTTTGPGGITYLYALASDGSVYISSYSGNAQPSAWSQAPTLAGSVTEMAAGTNNSAFTWLTDGTSVQSATKNSAGSYVTAPALPAGVTITDLEATKGSGGTTHIFATGSDGTVYHATWNGTAASTSSWTASPSLSGTVTDVSVGTDGSAFAWATDGTSVTSVTVNSSGSYVSTPTFPAGVTITDLTSTTGPGGITWIYGKGSDGSVYYSTWNGSASSTSAWTKSPSFEGDVATLTVTNNNSAAGWVTDGTSVKSVTPNGGGAYYSTQVLPNGASVKDVQVTKGSGGSDVDLCAGQRWQCLLFDHQRQRPAHRVEHQHRVRRHRHRYGAERRQLRGRLDRRNGVLTLIGVVVR